MIAELIIITIVQLISCSVEENNYIKVISELIIDDHKSNTYKFKPLLYRLKDYTDSIFSFYYNTSSICYLSFYYSVDYNSSILRKCTNENDSPIYLIDDSIILSDLYFYRESQLKKSPPFESFTNFTAVIYSGSTEAEILPQFISFPLFTISTSDFATIINLTFKYPKDVIFHLLFDNTDFMLPYTYITLARYFTFFTSLMMIAILIYYQKRHFTSIFIFMTILKLIYSIINWYYVNIKLQSESLDNYTYEVFLDIFLTLINWVYLTLMLSVLVLISDGWGLFYKNLDAQGTKLFFILFISIYMVLTVDYLVVGIDMSREIRNAFIEGKYMIVVIVTIFTSLRNLNKNINLLKYKIVYSLNFAREYYEALIKKSRRVVIIKYGLILYLICNCSAFFLFERYFLSGYIWFIKRTVRENIEAVFTLLIMLCTSPDADNTAISIIMNSKCQIKKVNIFKWNGKDILNKKKEVEYCHRENLPIIIINGVDKSDRFNDLCIGYYEF